MGQTRNWRENKDGISRARTIPSKEVTGGEGREGRAWGSQKKHDSSLGDDLANANRNLAKSMLGHNAATCHC